jgi:hypothetical protein
MPKWCDSTFRNAGAPTLFVGLCLATLACGPQEVPFPLGPQPFGAGTGWFHSPLAGSNAASAATRQSEQGSGGVTGSSNGAGSGPVRVIPNPDRTQTGAAQGGSSGPAPTQAQIPRGAAGAGPDTAGRSGGEVVPSRAETVPFDAGTEPNRNQVQASGLCTRIAAIQCAGEAHCCSAPKRSVTECQSTQRGSCNDQLYLDTLAANPITGFDSASTAVILEELENRSSQCDPSIAAWGLSSQGLRGILKGTLPANASCKPSGVNLMDKPSQAAALASCQDSDHYACLPKSLLGDWTCAPKSAAGGNCVTDDNCQMDMYCNNPNKAPLGRCAQRLQLGAACGASTTECSSLFCQGGQCVMAGVDVAYCGK